MMRSRGSPLAVCAAVDDGDVSERMDESLSYEDSYAGPTGARENGPRPPAATRTVVGGLGLALAAFSVLLPWLRVGMVGSVRLYNGTSLPVLSVVMIALPVLSMIAVAVGVSRRSATAEDLAMLGASLGLAIAGGLLGLVECASAIIPNGLLPATVRRYSLDLRAGPGLWLALIGSLVAVAALGGHLAPGKWLPRVSRETIGRGEFRLSVGYAWPPVALGLLAVAFGFLRYGSWVIATADDQSYGIGGWSLPVIGPLSLCAMLGLIVAAIASLTAQDDWVALLAGSAGCVIMLTAAITVLIADTVARVRVADFAPAQLQAINPHLGPGGAASASYLVGLATGAVAIALMSRTLREKA